MSKKINLTQQKAKLSGQLFEDVKAKIVEHPLEEYVSINCKYTHKEKGLLPIWFHVSGATKKVTIENGWSSLPSTPEEWTNLQNRDEIVTPWGTFTLYDNFGTGFPVISLPNKKEVPNG